LPPNKEGYGVEKNAGVFRSFQTVAGLAQHWSKAKIAIIQGYLFYSVRLSTVSLQPISKSSTRSSVKDSIYEGLSVAAVEQVPSLWASEEEEEEQKSQGWSHRSLPYIPAFLQIGRYLYRTFQSRCLEDDKSTSQSCLESTT
jgi:hypothetical protein